MLGRLAILRSDRAVERIGSRTVGAGAVLGVAEDMRELLRRVVEMPVRRPRKKQIRIALGGVIAGSVKNERSIGSSHQRVIRLGLEAAVGAIGVLVPPPIEFRETGLLPAQT